MSDTQTAVKDLVITRTFQAPREQVFAAWTDPAIMSRWFFPEPDWSVTVDIDLQVGGAFDSVMTKPTGETFRHFGEYREITPPEKLVFTWTNPGVVSDTLVTVEFTEVDGGTEMILTHSLFPTDAARDEHNKGWCECLENFGPLMEA